MTAEHRSALSSVRAIAEVPQSPEDTIEQTMRVLRHHLPKYQWVGVYVLHGDDLVLGPYVGVYTEHQRIPVGTGVCGTAVMQRHNQVVEDVRELTNYLSCSPTVRSEIVVLIWDGDNILGQIDADSDEPGAFTGEDEEFLTQVAQLLAPAVAKYRSQ